MLTEIAIAIILSICTTALLYIISNNFSKKWKINHPKNTIFISLIVLFTAFSIFPFATIAFSTIDAQPQTDIKIPDIKGTPISASTILTENQNITYTSSIIPLIKSEPNNANGITRYMQKITWSELIIYDEYQPTEQTYDPTITSPVNTTQFLKKILIAINQDDVDTPELINKIITNLIINQNIKQKSTTATQDDAKEKESSPAITIFSPQALFISGIGLLFLSSFFYVSSSIYFGKPHTLKRLKANPCKDQKIIDLITSIAKEFNIKTPKIYQFEGPPNAFVFGQPAVLVFSTHLQQYLTVKEFEAAFRHELAHIKHHDTILKPVLQGLRIFFFYNPFVHLLCRRIIKNMEFLADAQTFSSKKEKISLMEALIKISEYSKMPQTCPIPSYQIPLISYHSEKLTLTERFFYLFESTSKKSMTTILVAAIILLANVSLFFIVGAAFESNKTMDALSGKKQEFTIDESFFSESIQYTKVEKNAKTYLAMIVQKNLYNVISTKTPSGQLIDDMMQQLFPDEHLVRVPQFSCDSF